MINVIGERMTAFEMLRQELKREQELTAELLVALKELVRRADHVTELIGALDEAKAAIAKAEGQ
jgi:hypothetical protein